MIGAIVTGARVGPEDGTAEIEGRMSAVAGLDVGLADGKVLILGVLLGITVG